MSVVLVAIACAACDPPPPPKSPRDADADLEPSSKPKKKKKKACKTFEDECKGGGTKKTVVVGADGWRLAPPKGWLYAKLAEGTVTQESDKGAVLALVAVEAPQNPQLLFKARTDAVAALSGVTGIELKSPKTLFFGVSEAREVGELSLKLWEQAAKRGGSDGDAVVVAGKIDDKELVALGFVPADNDSGGNRIFDALETLEKKKATPEGSDK